MGIQFGRRPSEYAVYCVDTTQLETLCDLVTMGAFSLNQWVINSDSSLNYIIISLDDLGLISSVISWPDGELVNPAGQVVDTLQHSQITIDGQLVDIYSTVNIPVPMFGTWKARIPNIPIYVGPNSESCTFTFEQQYNSGSFKNSVLVRFTGSQMIVNAETFESLTIDPGDGRIIPAYRADGDKTINYSSSSTYELIVTPDLKTPSGDPSEDYFSFRLQQGNQGVTFVDASELRNYYDLRISNEPNLSSIIIGPSNVANSIIIAQNTSLLSVDLSPVQKFASDADPSINLSGNTAMTTFTMPGAAPRSFVLSNCNLGVLDFSTIPGLGQVDNFTLSLTYNNLTTSEVNEYLVHFASIFSAGYTGRILNLQNNSVPDSSSGGNDGVAAKTTLEGYGFTVNVDS